MTTPVQNTRLPLTLDNDSLRQAVGKSLGKALAASRPAVRELTHRQVAQCLSELLDLDVFELVIEAWRSCDDLVEAAERTRRAPGSRAVVDVAQQHFAARRDATLDIGLNTGADDVPLVTLPVRLEIGLELTGLTAVIINGCLTEIDSGAGKVDATLTLDEVALPAASQPFDLAWAVPVQPPILLLRQPAIPPPPAPLAAAAGPRQHASADEGGQG